MSADARELVVYFATIIRIAFRLQGIIEKVMMFQLISFDQELFYSLRDQIEDGRLKPGEKLPSVHEFAEALSISMLMAFHCFEQLWKSEHIEITADGDIFVRDISSQHFCRNRSNSN